jgi:hypothetical protein
MQEEIIKLTKLNNNQCAHAPTHLCKDNKKSDISVVKHKVSKTCL